jgi:broad specificity phosphatase PhoE
MNLALLPVAPCEWRVAGRLLGRVELPPAEGSDDWLSAATGLLAGRRLGKLWHSPDELATRTAKKLAASLKVVAKADDGLAELDLGLWVGLTLAELKSRFASAYRQLGDDPLAVQPPRGESLAGGAERVIAAVRKRAGKTRQPGEVTLFVLRPLALAAARCALQNGGDFGPLWEWACGPDEPRLIETALDGNPRPAS